jgi:hypothetical protein
MARLLGVHEVDYGLEQTLPSLSGWPPKLPHSRCSTAGASGC